MSDWLGAESWDGIPAKPLPQVPPVAPPVKPTGLPPPNRYWTLVVCCPKCNTTNVRVRSSHIDTRTVRMECGECLHTWKETGDGDFVRALIPV